MKKKLTAGQARILICLFCAVIFVLCYEFVYLKYEDKAEALTKNTELVQKQIEQSKTDLTLADELKAKTKELNSRSDEIINSFPVNIAKEDDLVFIDEMEKKLSINIPSVQISDTAECFETILPIRDENGKEIIASAQQYMTGLKSSITISFKVTTDKFLKLLDYIYEYPQKTSVSDVSLNYDGSTGDLMCSMTINRYALKGNGKKYEEPYIGNISIGTDDIFGTKSNKK